ncbi:hypothetical protein D9M68_879980 [compost metagenome]
MEEQRGNRHHQPRSRGDQRLGNATGEHRGVGHIAAHEGAENIDHRQHRTEQAEQRSNAGDGTEGIEVTLQLVHHPCRGLPDALLHDLATMLGVG